MTRDTPSTRGQAEQGPKGQAEHMQELLNFCLKTIGRLDSKSQKIEWSGQDFQDLSKIFQGIDVAIANVHSKSNLHTMTYKFGRGSTQRVMSPSSESKLGPEAKKGGLSDTPSKGSVMSESQKQELYLKALNVYALVWDFMKQMQSATIKGNIVTTLLKVRNNQTEGNSFLDLKFYKDVPDIIRLSKTRRFSTLDVMPGGRIKRMFSPGFSSSADSARAKQTFIQDMNQELGIWENELEATKVKEFMAKTHKTAFPTFHLGHSEQEFARLLLIQKTTIANSLESYIQDKSLT
ncbi:MAG: hypothetical protein HON23_04145, partial [Rickettsiales bacterium]|nr:hypothetical protein [Rickettsiales bacterium]